MTSEMEQKTSRLFDNLPSSSRGNPNGLGVLNTTVGNLDLEWKNWITRFKIFIRASGLDSESDDRKVALLLHYLGKECMDIFTSFNVDIDDVEFDELVGLFSKHFSPKKNLTVERFKLFSRKQNRDESLDNYVTVLKNLSLSCELQDLREQLVKDVMIAGLSSNHDFIREKLLLEDPDTLEKAFNIAKTMERSREECRELTRGEDELINSVQRRKSRKNENEKMVENCRYCGDTHKVRKCPAYGTKCKKCGKFNHFARLCKSKNNVNIVDESNSEDSDFYLNSLHSTEVNAVGRSWNIELLIKNAHVEVQIDTGAQANIISHKTLLKVGYKIDHLKKSHVKLTTLAGNNLTILGTINLNCSFKMKLYDLKFFVVDEDCRSILGLDSIVKLNLLKRINQCSSNDYNDIFQGLGCLKNIKVKLEVDPNTRSRWKGSGKPTLKNAANDQ